MGGGENGEAPSAMTPLVLPEPSCARRPERIARAIVAGEQPTGLATRQLIPDGLSHDAFLAAVASVKHPMESPPVVPTTLLRAMDHVYTMGPRLSQWREEQMTDIRQTAAR